MIWCTTDHKKRNLSSTETILFAFVRATTAAGDEYSSDARLMAARRRRRLRGSIFRRQRACIKYISSCVCVCVLQCSVRHTHRHTSDGVCDAMRRRNINTICSIYIFIYTMLAAYYDRAPIFICLQKGHEERRRNWIHICIYLGSVREYVVFFSMCRCMCVCMCVAILSV